MSTPQYTISNDSITVILEGVTYAVPKSDPSYAKVRKAIYAQRWDDLPALLVKGKSVTEWLGKGFTFKDRKIWFEGDALPDGLSKRMVAMHDKGDDPANLMRFWHRLAENPSYRSVQQLWAFLDHHGIPIDPAGFILAYKAVTREYKDIHSRKFDNRPGCENSMRRNKISDDPKVACHEGFHVGALSYARSFGGSNSRIVICRVNPRDVVCVPYDSSHMKVRVCKYKVIGNLGDQMPSTVIGEEDLPPEVSPPVAADVSEATNGKPADPDVEVVTDPEPVKLTLEDADVPAPKKKAPKKKAPKKKAPKKNTAAKDDESEIVHAWMAFDSLADEELAKQSLEALRKYATNGLLIVGGGSLRGGKPALLERIKDIRGEK